MTATFGDFLEQAANPLAEAASVRDLPSSTVIACAIQLHRLTTALSRYVADPRTFPAPAEATTIRVRLYQAATSLRRAAEAGAGLPGPGAALPLPERIGTAANALVAGLDLLATHFTTDQDDNVQPRSPWALALATPSARSALLAELAGLTSLAGSACLALGQVPSPALPAASRKALLTAGSKLAAITPAVRASPDLRRSQGGNRELLRAVPAGITPTRQPAGEPEGLARLSDAIGMSAARLRALTWRPPAQQIWPPPPALAAWRWSAYAAAIAGHTSELILNGLAERSRQLLPGANGPTLAHAATAMGTSWNAWRHVASASASASGMFTDAIAWNIVSPVSDDLTDLITRLGRIAYENPRWTPAASQRAPLKSPADLAPGLTELRLVLAAVHHTADTLATIASADLAAVQAAADAGMILRGTPAENVLPRAAGIAGELPRLYEFTRDAANRAAEAIDLPAITTGAPSSYLAVLRSAPAPGPAPVSGEIQDPDLTRFRLLEAVHELKPAQFASLWRASFPGRPIPNTAASEESRPEAPRVRAPRLQARSPHTIG